MKRDNVAWCSTWAEFLRINHTDFMKNLHEFNQSRAWIDKISESQIFAWQTEWHLMQSLLAQLAQSHSGIEERAWIAFEQELPGENGKRAADVNLILPTGDLFVLEFKHKVQPDDGELWRAQFDLQTLLHFHDQSHDLTGHVFLVMTQGNALEFHDDKVACEIAKAGQLPHIQAAIEQCLQQKSWQICDCAQWQHGKFARQPSVFAGTIEVFCRGNIPHLKNNEAEENIREARKALQNLYQRARDEQQHYVVVVNGRPGAGKTLLGMSLVAEVGKEAGAQPVLLSGNRSLVEVLRYTIDYHGHNQQVNGAMLIGHLLEFKKAILQSHHNRNEDFVIFDEAQRAWDKVKQYNHLSELHLLCDYLASKPFGVLMLLVGDGQAIHNNEMDLPEMFEKLADALQRNPKIQVVLPPAYRVYLPQAIPVQTQDCLFLQTPIRQSYTQYLDAWINAVLANQTDEASKLAAQLHQNYVLYITHHFAKAEHAAREIHHALTANSAPKYDRFRMGWLQSSQAKNKWLPENASEQALGKWFVEQPHSPDSCCQFKAAATEFSCQGLELSLALLAWGDDWQYHNGAWHERRPRSQSHYVSGSYRVLLSRGRTGLIVYCDDEQTFDYLLKCGMKWIGD